MATVRGSIFGNENTASHFVKYSTTTKPLNVALKNPCSISALGNQWQWVAREFVTLQRSFLAAHCLHVLHHTRISLLIPGHIVRISVVLRASEHFFSAPPADCFLHSQTGPSISRRVAQHVLIRTAPRAFPPVSTSIMNIASI
ncbi:hypothetical protein T10_5888 [Trichinella papuae]|uniref:Uncharacterized protein n=1 Tax=Trichinella papuae TaxID=268474 RepID=A0A0V1N8X1_9BILA|nr:hypothetical protein T10_5888 [Trichinella papuae]